MALNKESTSDSESEYGKSDSGQVVPGGPNLPGAEKGAGTWEVAVAKANAAAEARKENRIQVDKEEAEKFKQDQIRLAQENVQQFQQESKEE